MEGMSAERYKELYGSKPKSKLDQPSESAEQIALFQWANFASGQYPCLDMMYHVPNGGKRDKATAGRLKAEGVRAGVPDICLPVPSKNYHGLYIELKVKDGKLSTIQRQWLHNLSAQGYMATICYGWEDAKDVILKYLRGQVDMSVIKEDCKDCTWYELRCNKPYCKVEKSNLQVDADGKVTPPSNCHYSPNYKRRR